MNWFRYFWYNQARFEPFHGVVDTLMVVSCFRHTRNLSLLFYEPDHVDAESSSGALYWAAGQGHSSSVRLLFAQPRCDPKSSITIAKQLYQQSLNLDI